MTAHFQFFMILGAAILLLIIFALLKKGQMSVKYSLLWLALAVVLVIFAVFPYVVYVLRTARTKSFSTPQALFTTGQSLSEPMMMATFLRFGMLQILLQKIRARCTRVHCAYTRLLCL